MAAVSRARPRARASVGAMSYKLYALWSAPDDADADAFEDQYMNVHVPLAAALPGIQRLVTTMVTGSLPGLPSPYYRVAELEWDSEEAFQAATESPEWAAMGADSADLVARFGVSAAGAIGAAVLAEPAVRS
jgi:uncharacterized protein (TIGR02118 family)